jgi:hypothetical protein
MNCFQLVRFRSKRLKTVGRIAFERCSALSEINLSKVVEIGYEAFSYCISLVNVELLQLKVLRNYFGNCTNIKQLVIPKLE